MRWVRCRCAGVCGAGVEEVWVLRRCGEVGGDGVCRLIVSGGHVGCPGRPPDRLLRSGVTAVLCCVWRGPPPARPALHPGEGRGGGAGRPGRLPGAPGGGGGRRAGCHGPRGAGEPPASGSGPDSSVPPQSVRPSSPGAPAGLPAVQCSVTAGEAQTAAATLVSADGRRCPSLRSPSALGRLPPQPRHSR